MQLLRWIVAFLVAVVISACGGEGQAVSDKGRAVSDALYEALESDLPSDAESLEEVSCETAYDDESFHCDAKFVGLDGAAHWHTDIFVELRPDDTFEWEDTEDDYRDGEGALASG